MRGRRAIGALMAAAGAVSLGCVTMPTGPSVMVLPGQGKPFEVFQADDAMCRQWAGQQAGGSPAAVANANAATTAAVGTAVGAGLGAAVGAASGNAGTGAAIGAGSGLLGGTLAGAGAASASGWQMQQRYDIAYQQCMYAKGNQIPGVVQQASRYSVPPPPPPGRRAPPPPRSTPPPPPPRP